MLVKLILLIAFFSLMIIVGIRSRKSTVDVDGFVLGGRKVGPYLTAFAYGTSYFSAVVFVGYAGQFGWKYGLSSTWIGLGNAIIGSLVAWLVLGKRTRLMTRKMGSRTMPDFFGTRYDSSALRIVASVIVFIFLIPYTASVYNGLSRLFGMAFNIPYRYCVMVMAVFTALYVIIGGYMATAMNDFIQGIIMLIGIVAIIVAVISLKGGFSAAVGELSMIKDEGVAAGEFTALFGPDPLNLLGVVILTSLGTWGLPQMVGKFYTIKNEQAVKTGTIVSTVFAIIVAGGSYFLGGFGRLFDNPALYNSETGAVMFDAVVPTMLSNLPDALIGLVVVLVLSASMSTLSSLVLTSSSTMTLDLLKDNVIKDMSEKRQVLIMRILIVFFIALSVVLAIDPPTFIAQLMGISWGTLACSFLAPFLYGLYWKGVTKASVWACFVSGVGITVANIFFKFIKSPINAGAFTMLIGLVIVPVVSMFTKKMEQKKVDEIFECYSK